MLNDRQFSIHRHEKLARLPRREKKFLPFFDFIFVRKSFIVSPEMHGEKIC